MASEEQSEKLSQLSELSKVESVMQKSPCVSLTWSCPIFDGYMKFDVLPAMHVYIYVYAPPVMVQFYFLSASSSNCSYK